MKILPIIPGCRAIIIGGADAGSEIVALKPLGNPDMFRIEPDGLAKYEDLWVIDPLNTPIPDYISESCKVYVIREAWLMRIDGGSFEDEKAVENLLQEV